MPSSIMLDLNPGDTIVLNGSKQYKILSRTQYTGDLEESEIPVQKPDGSLIAIDLSEFESLVQDADSALFN